MERNSTMSDVVIRVENLCKEYRLGTISHGTLYRDLQSGWAKFRGEEDPNVRIDLVNTGQLNSITDRFCALKDISFDVEQGEIVGIIGRNGAGKSTLLKIISRVTAPTEGTIKIKGRVASLLEVGTGFHPELTGRENIFLNGAILGMHTWEIEQKFDEIVKFSEIDKFIDTPVKRYSSGMYVRLAFAVAAHLEPEILLVDEVLAVGDIPFQKKCLGKMREVAQGGRTILFVSHNMDAIKKLCTRTVLLHEGKVVMDGSPEEVIGKYLMNKMGCLGERTWPDITTAPGDNVVRMRAARVLDQNGKICTSFDVRDPIIIELEYHVLEEGHHLHVHLSFIKNGYTIFSSKDNLDSPWRDTVCPTGHYRSTCHIPGDFLNEGEVSIYCAITTVGTGNIGHVNIEELLIFDVSDRMDPGGVRGNYPLHWERQGVRPRLLWNVKNHNS